jgi:protein-tyrosine phosphatase
VSEFEGTYNFRDVGGMPLTSGGTTSSGVLARSDALHALKPRGVEQLAHSPIDTIVDLRTAVERDTARDRLPETRRIREHHLPLLEGAMSHIVEQTLAAHALGDHAAAGRAAQAAIENLPTLAQLYGGMLEHGAASFAEVARLVGGGEGAVLVHCTAGKDRTGVAVAVLLDAVGVEREAIAADYVLSAENLGGAWFDRMRGMVTMMGVEVTPALAELIAGSPRDAIDAVFAWLDAHDGSAAYLASGGLSPAELAALRDRLTS